MSSRPIEVQQSIRFGEDFELDFRPRRLRRRSRVLKLERIPLEILVLLLERRGDIVAHADIVARVWGSDVFLDTENSIRGAIRKIRQVLKDDPEQPRFIETVTGRGYRFIAPVIDEEHRESGRDALAQTANSTSFISELDGWLKSRKLRIEEDDRQPRAETLIPARRERQSRRQKLGRWLVVGGVAVSVLLAGASIAVRRRLSHTTNLKLKSLAVLPLKNLSGDPGQEYLADGMTEELIGRLAAIHELRVISRTSVMLFKGSQLSAPDIARKLGVDAIVEGSVMREGTRIRVHAQLIRAATDDHFWSETYDRQLPDVLSLESEVAEAIARKIAWTIAGEEHARLAANRHISPEVYEDYLRAEFAGHQNSRSELNESIRYYEEAVKEDPNFAPAYLGLAKTYDTLGLILVGAPPNEIRPKVIAAARKALELDPQLAQAHILLAGIYQKEWRWSEAEAEYKQALALEPNGAAARLGLARWLLAKGRTEEAVEWAKGARDLDPLYVSGTDLGWILFNGRHYDDAVRELHAELAVHPEDSSALWYLGFVLIAQGHADEAIPPLEKAFSVTHASPGVMGVLVRAYARADRRKEALDTLDQLKRRKLAGYIPAGAFVQAYIGLGDNEQAIFWLEQSYKEQSNLMQWIKVEPTFDPLRGDPRFIKLVQRIGL